MKLTETNYDNSETRCCARLYVDRWDGQELSWQDKPFLKQRVWQLMHMPLNFGRLVDKTHATIEKAEAYPAEPLWLMNEISPWRGDFLVALDREIDDAPIERISGTFMTKVFEGPYRDTGKWIQALGTIVSEAGHTLRHTYVYYATCPSCAKHFGANRTVLFGRVA